MDFRANFLYIFGFIYIPKKSFGWRTRRWLRRTFRLYSDPAQIAAYIFSRQTDEHMKVIALFDAGAVIYDVLSFYQERIANEGFLRTATERRSILELARSIGYELNPGVAAGTYLAFTVDDSDTTPAEAPIPAGTQVQSIPRAQDESNASTAFFAVTTIATILVLLALWQYATRGYRLVDRDIDRRIIPALTRVILTGVVISAIGMAFSYVVSWAGLLALVAMAYMVIATAYGRYRPAVARTEVPKQA